MHAGCLEGALIPNVGIKSLCRVVRDATERYVGQLEPGESEYAARCDLSSIKHHDRFIGPGPEIGQLEYCSRRSQRTAAVLAQFNQWAGRLLAEFHDDQPAAMTTVDALSMRYSEGELRKNSLIWDVMMPFP